MSYETKCLRDKSKALALRDIRLYTSLCNERREFVMSKQTLRCGKSIGANITESIYGQSKTDFISKMSIAQKEANETEYWLELLHESDYITNEQFNSIMVDVEEIQKMLASTTMTMKAKLGLITHNS